MTLSLDDTEVSKPAAKRIALLICNSNFPNIPGARLVGPAKDAETLDGILSDPEICQFEVRKVVDGGLRQVRLEIARICGDADVDDTIVIYYSGNATTGKDGSFCLLVYDTEDKYPFATGLDADFILSQLRDSRCRKSVLLIDGCHSGAFFAHNRGVPNGLYAITSCGAEEVCMDTPEGGPFTLALAEGLRHAAADADGDGRVSIDELHEFVKRRLSTQGHQGNPQKWVWNVPEPIYLATAPSPVFLSYAREDVVAADQLASALKAEGLSVWIDRQDIQSGSWKERVTEGLTKACATVFLLTAASLKSSAVRKELSFAAKKSVPIIPVQIGEINEALLPDWYTLDFDELHRHVIDPTSQDYSVRTLASAIRSARRRGEGTAGGAT